MIGRRDFCIVYASYLAVASAMLNAFLGWLVHDQPQYEEVYLDVLLGRVTPVQRTMV